MQECHIISIGFKQGHFKSLNQGCDDKVELCTHQLNTKASPPTLAKGHLELPSLLPSITKPMVRIENIGLREHTFRRVCAARVVMLTGVPAGIVYDLVLVLGGQDK
ncbi:uncharacterized protein BO80DRAFT_125238 [Aspergillus ibericus CBS 121593]|uniref:Uncharacterized protein n=1 Tax=Aspergillus ibericus CBS 121593 TaxID=1448316 RepID=A0A395GVA2_9EURO|nr:hypothetical protein BO80DRAFT_125238 [Aspergillus ibericus CBS 121593]RAK99491.1 hypothetical protein BO80DRAFT_125238 [Aspergillus ibericus CBS 121593]